MQIINPATEEIITSVQEDNRESLQQKYETLRKAQPAWAGEPLENRVKILRQFHQLLETHRDELAEVLTAEVGKPLTQSRNEINGARARTQWLCDNAVKYLSEEWMTREDGLGEKIVYEPHGVICNISAWNYPYLVGVNVFVPALLAGNAVMYKPSEYATLTGLKIAALLHEAGVPAGVFQVAMGARDTGTALLDMPFDGYYFTGSYRTGQYIYEKVAPKMVPCQLELGGKDPLYITDDINDIAAVAAGTADGAFYNAGQSCCAVERIYVHENVYDRYVEEFVKEVKSYKVGMPDENGVYIGPLTRKDQVAFLEQQVKDAIAKGAVVACGGHALAGKGNYFEPTVLTNVNHDMLVMKEESFGPIIGIMKVSSDEEALQRMADTEYGLTAGVYCNDMHRAENILSRLNTGTGYWNCCDRVSAPVPWSGRKHSGFGSTLSHSGLRAFTKPKAYHLRGFKPQT